MLYITVKNVGSDFIYFRFLTVVSALHYVRYFGKAVDIKCRQGKNLCPFIDKF